MRGSEEYNKAEQQPQSNYHRFQGHLLCYLVTINNHLTFLNEQNTRKKWQFLMQYKFKQKIKENQSVQVCKVNIYQILFVQFVLLK